eukprot:m51a1_g6421 hypothetical protein (1142) ;mRNA; r:306659-311712
MDSYRRNQQTAAQQAQQEQVTKWQTAALEKAAQRHKTTEDSRPLWQPDHLWPECRACSLPFTFSNRKHHCRMCGYIFHKQCSATKVVLPSSMRYGSTPQRVCSACRETVSEARRQTEDDVLTAQMALRATNAAFGESLVTVGELPYIAGTDVAGPRAVKTSILVRDGPSQRLLVVCGAPAPPFPLESDKRRAVIISAISSMQYSKDRNRISVVRDIYQKGSLRDLIHKIPGKMRYSTKHSWAADVNGTPLDADVVAGFGRSILDGLAFFKRAGLPYPHLHSGNVLLMGKSCLLSGFENVVTGIPPFYAKVLASKSLEPHHYEAVCFGMVLLEMITGSVQPLSAMPAKPEALCEVLRAIFPSGVPGDTSKPPAVGVNDLLRMPVFGSRPGPVYEKQAENIPTDKHAVSFFKKLGPAIRDQLQGTMQIASAISLVRKATSDDPDPTPGYVFLEIRKMSEKSPGACEALADQLAQRMKNSSAFVRLKALRCARHALVDGSPAFRLHLQRHIDDVRSCTTFSGPPDRFLGDEPYRNIQQEASELLNVMFQPAPEARPAMHASSDGSSYASSLPSSRGRLAASSSSALGSTVTSALESAGDTLAGAVRSVATKFSPSPSPPAHRHHDRVLSNGLPPTLSSSSPLVGSPGPYEAPRGAPPAAEQPRPQAPVSSDAGDCNPEAALVASVVADAGVHAAPTRSELEEFVRAAAGQDLAAVQGLLFGVLSDANWKCRLRSLCAMEALLEAGTAGVAEYISGRIEDVRAMYDSPQASIKSKAQRVAELCGGQSPLTPDTHHRPQQQQQQQASLIDFEDAKPAQENDMLSFLSQPSAAPASATQVSPLLARVAAAQSQAPKPDPLAFLRSAPAAAQQQQQQQQQSAFDFLGGTRQNQQPAAATSSTDPLLMMPGAAGQRKEAEAASLLDGLVVENAATSASASLLDGLAMSSQPPAQQQHQQHQQSEEAMFSGLSLESAAAPKQPTSSLVDMTGFQESRGAVQSASSPSSSAFDFLNAPVAAPQTASPAVSPAGSAFSFVSGSSGPTQSPSLVQPVSPAPQLQPSQGRTALTGSAFSFMAQQQQQQPQSRPAAAVPLAGATTASAFAFTMSPTPQQARPKQQGTATPPQQSQDSRWDFVRAEMSSATTKKVV